jgi:MFS family permease
MATSAETRVVNAAGVVQGIALVTFPAASTILTDPAEYDLSSSEYGALFLPQVVTAIAAALLGASLGGRFGTKRVYLAGLCAGFVSMTLLLASAVVAGDSGAYPLLLLATACLGAGFGLTVPALNTMTADFHHDAPDRAVLVLDALLGFGTVLAPVFVAIFDGLGAWWGLPLTSAILLAVLVLVSARLPLEVRAAPATESLAPRGIPRRFWVYAGFSVLYGVCETVNGNWAQLDMTDLGASTLAASIALTAFWAMVTLGRILFAAIEAWFPSRLAYHVLPLVLAGAFVLTALLPDDRPALGVVAFGLAGLGCSALLPLTISFGQEELSAYAAAAAGGVIAFYQLGYGIAAFGVGPLRDAGVELSTVYALAAIVAVAMCAWSFVVAGRRSGTASMSLPGPGAR